MKASTRERAGVAAGVLFAALLLAGLLLQAAAVGGAEDESRLQVEARYSDGGNELLAEVGALLVGLAVAALLLFLSGLRTTLRAVGAERAATVVLAGGIVMAALLAVSATTTAAAFSSYDFYDAYETDASTVLLMQSVAFYALGFALVGAGALVAATSLVALRTALLPRWLAVAGVALGVALLFGEWALFFTFPVPLFLLWTALVSILLLRRLPEPALETRAVAAHNP